MVAQTKSIPEQGQFVSLRNRFWLVQDIIQDNREQTPSHRVLLECLDDDNMGQTLSVIWEHEINTEVYTRQGLPRPEGWDIPAVFDAFVAAIRLSSSSILEREG